MQHFTAIYKDEVISLTDQSSEEIGQLKFLDKNEVKFETNKNFYQFIIGNKTIEIFKNGDKIDGFEKYNVFGYFKSQNTGMKIKGISSWQGGTKLLDSENQTLVTLQNKSPLVDKGIYEFETFSDVEPYLLILILNLHIKSSKKKTLGAIIFAGIASHVLTNYVDFY